MTEAAFTLEMCAGMGFPVAMGIPWDSHVNGNEKQISMGMGMGMISVGVGMLENAFLKKFPLISYLKLTKE